MMAEVTPGIDCPVCKTRHVTKEDPKSGGVLASTCENCNHFFKYRVVPPFRTNISFTVNGVDYTAGNEFTPSTSLADFLREKRVSMGTKLMCRQGGCGICIVVANMQLDPSQPKVVAAINSCLCPLFLCDGWEITTVEGLGSTRTGMPNIQSHLANYNGTQCGYCSPGQVMNMYGLTMKYSKLSKQFVEDHLEGNLCRCTGYRPILDAFKALVPAPPKDIEDVGEYNCTKYPDKQCDSKRHCVGSCKSVTPVKSVRMVFGNIQWFKAGNYADLLKLLQQYSGHKIRLMGAYTGTGAFYLTENINNFDIVIDISGVSEFYINTFDASTKTFTLGANVTLSDMIDLFTQETLKPGSNGAFSELKKYLYRVASSPIRNRATWSGNLMLKNHNKAFPSDVFNIMTVLKSSLYIGPTSQDFLTPDAFLTADMAGKAISRVTFGSIPANDVIACFKVMPRSQNSLALVNAAIRCTVDPQNNYIVSGQPVISIGGISGTFHRAIKTEAYLIGKQLSSTSTLRSAMSILASELVPSNDIHLPSAAYRKLVACALVYKYFLRVLGTSAGTRYRSGSTVLHDTRSLSSGKQSYDTKKSEWPLNQPLKKLEADIQCTGEAEYTDDVAPLPGQLYASFVKSSQANAKIQSIDTSAALGIPGVFRVLTATDIPAGGVNDITGTQMWGGSNKEVEEALASGRVQWYGQPIALVLAVSQEIADHAAAMVKVDYIDIQPPIVTINDAIQKQSFFPFPAPGIPQVNVGDAAKAIALSPFVTSGSFYVGNQYHFHMETQSSVAVPTDEGLNIIASTQFTDCVQQGVAQICGIPKNRVTVEVKRLGGGFGAKMTRSNMTACVCGLAAFITNRPVRMKLSLWDNMEMVGKRMNYKVEYQVGHDASGKLNGIELKYYAELGYLKNENNIPFLYGYMDNCYFCPNWKAIGVAVKTNKPVNPPCRGPASVPAIFMMEQMMRHVAQTLNKDPVEIKTLNFYKQGQVTPSKMTLTHCNIEAVMTQLMTTAEVKLRETEIGNFNRVLHCYRLEEAGGVKVLSGNEAWFPLSTVIPRIDYDNRWKKKALAVVPMKWGANPSYYIFPVLVNIYAKDGSVLVHHGGVEMGQGINTKVAQVCAFELDIPVTMVTVRGTNTIVEPNNLNTGGSVTSETCCQGVIICCTNIKARMAPVKAKMVNPTWKDLVNECVKHRVPLSEKVINVPPITNPYAYNIYAATCSEVELDVLTGEYQVNRADIVYDCGESLSPLIDIGQIEGGFVMGMGYSMGEEIKYDTTTGKILTNDTWSYFPPTSKDIPVDFRISLLKNTPNPSGVLRSKATGEPAVCMGCSVFFALRKCIEEARKEAGHTENFDFYPPATVEKVQTLCMVDTSQFKLQ